MQSSKPVLLTNLRRLGMIIGLAILALFVYKASHEVSNPKIAAGAQHTQLASQGSQASPAGVELPGYGVPAAIVQTPAVSNEDASTHAAGALASSDESAADYASKKQPKSEDKLKNAKPAVSSADNSSED